MPTLDLPFLAGSTAPVSNLVFTLSGPFTTFTVTSPDGDEFTYNATVGAGQLVTIDVGEGTLQGVGGHLPDPRNLTYTGSGGFTVLPSGSPSVDYTSDGGFIRVDGAPLYST